MSMSLSREREPPFQKVWVKVEGPGYKKIFNQLFPPIQKFDFLLNLLHKNA